MRKTLITLAAIAAFGAAPAFAQHGGHGGHGDHAMHGGGHTMGVTTSPKDGETVAAPKELAFTFGHAMTLENLVITTPTGETIPLSALPEGPAETLSVPLPALGPDDYTVNWRANAGDHTMTGSFRFTVKQ